MSKIFFYGTLMRGFPLADEVRISQRLTFCGRGRIKGWLYDLGPYPAAIESAAADGVVFGELYELRDEVDTLKLLDAIEGFDPARPERSLYTRKQVNVQLEDGSQSIAWVYFYNRPLKDAHLIRSGDYRQYILHRGGAENTE